MRRRITTTLLAGLLVAPLLVPSIGHARSDDTCGRGGKPVFATFKQPQGGQLLVNTAATGPIAVDAAGDAVIVSTTGTVPVEVDYSCIMEMTLTVVKNDPVAGPQTVDTHTWSDADLNGDPADGPCLEGVATTEAQIGLDGGDYDFILTGTACTGQQLTPVEGGAITVDPPLGI